VSLADNGQVTEDDGDTLWRSTLIHIGWCQKFGDRQIAFVADVHADSYSGNTVAHINQDDFALPPDLAGRLAICLYWICGDDMREINADLGETAINLESLIVRAFDPISAQRILDKLRRALTIRPAERARSGQGAPHVRPSISTDTPKDPILPAEARKMAQTLRRVPTHEEFMRLIGVPESDIVAVEPRLAVEPPKFVGETSRKKKRNKKRSP